MESQWNHNAITMASQWIHHEIIANHSGQDFKKVEEDSLSTSIVENENVDGAPLFDVEGRVAGLADADLQGNIFVIPSSVLRIFLGL